jgi:hypothetical protein
MILPPRPGSPVDRRTFLRRAAGLAAAGLVVPGEMLAGELLAERAARDPWAPLVPPRPTGDPVRVRGRVVSSGRGLARVGISDGLRVVETDGDGRFELVSDSARDFVSVSLPAGHRIPVNETGTARFYQPLRPDGRGEMEALFELEPLAGPAERPDERHTMLFLPDIQTQNDWEMARFHELSVPDVAATVREQGDRPVFGIAAGDIMFDDLSLYPEYERGVRRMGAPFFQVVGNHDLDFEGRTDEASTTTFNRHFGPRYYSFDRGAVHYVVLDDVLWHGAGYIGYLERDQLAWLEADLARIDPGRPVVVALHIPVVGTRHWREGERSPSISGSVTNREALVRLLEPFQAHVLSGHTHENDHNHGLGFHEHVSGTVCGAWWSGPICGDGTPHGYSVYEVDGEEIRWRYKSTGHPADHQMRAYRPGADRAAPRELLVNAWDADDGWTLDWYEDGERRGRMARRIGYDPASVRIHTGEELPPRRSWVDPYPRWIHHAPASTGAGELRVEATDRFGRTYTAVAGPVPAGMEGWEETE